MTGTDRGFVRLCFLRVVTYNASGVITPKAGLFIRKCSFMKRGAAVAERVKTCAQTVCKLVNYAVNVLGFVRRTQGKFAEKSIRWTSFFVR